MMRLFKCFMVMMLGLIFISGCSGDDEKLETPTDVGIALFKAINKGRLFNESSEYYEDFVRLFSEKLNDNATIGLFEQLNGISSSGGSSSTYELLQYNNGEMLLIQLFLDPEDDEYKIYDIYIVPEELKEFFRGK